ncbi:hypothetical protein AK830_g1011 [Neonectria ditissima]|uniref:RING-type domain-containing protein n=1 Tax=Neonectria ditissima TaxID=78410 RepID=A0A0P7BXI0_9HYPO|nr:hypothetical protein AK830_g1011 [Neonectria ditissima]
MDPMDYILHNQSRPTAQYAHAASPPWESFPTGILVCPLEPHPHSLMPHQSYTHHTGQPAPAPGSDPFQLAPTGGWPLPNPNYRPVDIGQAGLASLEAPGHYHHSQSLLRMSGMPVAAHPGPANHLGPGSYANDGAFVNQVPEGRPLSFHQPAGRGMPPAGNNNLEPNSLPRPLFPSSDLPTNTFSPHQHPHFAVPPPPPLSGPFNSTQSRRGHVSSSSTPSRSLREAPSPASKFRAFHIYRFSVCACVRVTRMAWTFEEPLRPSFTPPLPKPLFLQLTQSAGSSQQPSTSRRSHPRTRRSMSSRFMASDANRDDDDELGRQMFLDHILHGAARSEPNIPDHVVDDAMIRQFQLVRGAVSSKMVASKMTIRSLQRVDIADLPEAERACVICYNDYGIETPEGINETPLRLPKCKHVFGDHCIKKWFEDSDSCPYCRDKLHSEPKQHGTSARAFMNMMRMRGVSVPPGLTSNADEVYMRALALSTASADAESGRSGSRQTPSGGRRSPPDDANEQRRRTRPRHSMGNHSAEWPTTTFTRTGPSPTGANASGGGNVPNSVSGRPSQRSSDPDQAEARRVWQNVLSEPSDLARQPPSFLPSNSMSPSAPTFYPRNFGRSEFLTARTQPSSSSLSAPRLPNPLQSVSGVGLEEQQGDARSSASQLHPANIHMPHGPGDSDRGSQDQGNRNRPW